MIEITDEIVTKAAMSDAEFDGRPWAAVPNSGSAQTLSVR